MYHKYITIRFIVISGYSFTFLGTTTGCYKVAPSRESATPFSAQTSAEVGCGPGGERSHRGSFGGLPGTSSLGAEITEIRWQSASPDCFHGGAAGPFPQIFLFHQRPQGEHP